ncbi:SGNH/GDSL hydrolase family protein [Weissella paramesenteroides]|uniref:SGNH/GDSL hydrolase family protein n=1 Tax=Weissella paramesenteroides TaxID=1249 RepID=UPI0023A968D5|nr:SGNH/GDSL hydrolase family protein [Weissella paramesenteroides]WEA53650.1 SGNH/GDSL hydrolase family protein [Weissella paramesenteroides]
MNVIVFGDSIVAGQELVREETPYRDAVYAKLASYGLNARKLENFAETGTGQFKGQYNLDYLAGWTHSFEGSIKHYKQEIEQADVALIAYGNNDWKQLNPDGSLHTLTEVKDKLRQNIHRIRKINDKIQLVGVLETLAFRKKKAAWHLEGPNGFTYKDMVAAYTEIYEEQGVPVFDIRDYHIGNHIDEYVDDRDHFTLDIHKQIAKSLTDFVKHDYQSPAQRFGETDKYIFKSDLFENSNMRKQLFETIKDNARYGRQAEILWFGLYLNDTDQDDLSALIKMNELPVGTKFTNVYQYYAAPLRYNGKLDKLILKDGTLLNEQQKPFIKFKGQTVSRLLHGETWSKAISKQEFNDLWVKHYVSLKDQVWVWQDDHYGNVSSKNDLFENRKRVIMKFLDETGHEITLKHSETLPGYEVTLAEDTVIDSAVNNPFFKGINVLQLPKKLKGFRDNPDLKTLLEPQKVNTGVKVVISDKEFVWFEPILDLATSKKLNLVNHVFGNEAIVQPYFVNMGLKKVTLHKGRVIGTLLAVSTN